MDSHPSFLRLVKCKKCNKDIITQSCSPSRWVCKDCKSKRIKEYNRKYCQNNKEYKHKQYKKYIFKNGPKLKEYNKSYSKQYYNKNKKKILINCKLYRLRNRDRIVQYHAHCRRTDPIYKIQRACRRRLNGIIKAIKFNKTINTLNLVGCSWGQLKNHLESQFQSGMNWDNYGTHGWHIDHIIPCASFDLTKVEEQQKCFHYTNLQPLWAVDNLKKGYSDIFCRKFTKIV